MDFSLDSKKARQFNCSTCDAKTAYHRNCDGTLNQNAKNQFNGHIYTSCPKGLILREKELHFLVELYMDCRESGMLPYPGSMMDQTNFTKDLFHFLDGIMGEYRLKKHQERMEEARKQQNG